MPSISQNVRIYVLLCSSFLCVRSKGWQNVISTQNNCFNEIASKFQNATLSLLSLSPIHVKILIVTTNSISHRTNILFSWFNVVHNVALCRWNKQMILTDVFTDFTQLSSIFGIFFIQDSNRKQFGGALFIWKQASFALVGSCRSPTHRK